MAVRDSRPVRLLEQLRDPEIEELHEPVAAALDDEDVVRRQVAVDDPARGKVLEPVRGLHEKRHGLRPRPAREGRQGRAVEVLHREPGRSVLLADLEERDDVHVEEALEDRGLAVEAHARLGEVRVRLVAGPLGLADDLQRDHALVALVDGLVHDAHAAAADPLQDAVMGDALDGAGQPVTVPCRPPPDAGRCWPGRPTRGRSSRRRRGRRRRRPPAARRRARR